MIVCVCRRDGSGLLEEGKSCLPGTEDYGTTPCGMLKAAGVWEGWALNQFRKQSHLSKSLTTTVSSFFNCLSTSAFHAHTLTLHHPRNIHPFSISLFFFLTKCLNRSWFPKRNPSDSISFSPCRSNSFCSFPKSQNRFKIAV